MLWPYALGTNNTRSVPARIDGWVPPGARRLEHHAIDIPADPGTALAAVGTVRLRDVPIVGALFRMRGIPHQAEMTLLSVLRLLTFPGPRGGGRKGAGLRRRRPLLAGSSSAGICHPGSHARPTSSARLWRLGAWPPLGTSASSLSRKAAGSGPSPGSRPRPPAGHRVHGLLAPHRPLQRLDPPPIPARCPRWHPGRHVSAFRAHLARCRCRRRPRGSRALGARGFLEYLRALQRCRTAEFGAEGAGPRRQVLRLDAQTPWILRDDSRGVLPRDTEAFVA